MLLGILFAAAALGAEVITGSRPGSCTPRIPDLFSPKDDTCPRITNLDSHPENHPWTHEAHCLETPEDDLGDRLTFCLYTRASSGSRREFSIVTTPELAKTLSLKDLTDDPKLGAKKSPVNSTSPLYVTRKTRGRGVGLFATREISAGQVILNDSPVFITLRDALDYLPRTDRQELQWRGVFQLSVDAQRLLLNLSTSRGGDQIDDILQTNSIGLSLGDKRGYLALMPQVAVRKNRFLNHSALHTLENLLTVYRESTMLAAQSNSSLLSRPELTLI
jgi:hypothetical protein